MTDLVIVGEAWGEQEERLRKPFIGKAGKILNGMLKQASIDRQEAFITNVFNLRPRPTNDVSNLCGPRETGIEGMPYLQKSKYVRAEFAPELERLYSDISEHDPNLILALGGTASWALLHNSTITKIRGTVSVGVTGHKVLPTYHPAAIARNWAWRAVAVMDLYKARREMEFPEVRKPDRHVWIEPTIEDLFRYEKEHIHPSPELSIDIETIPSARSITCIGFAPSEDSALVVPFYDPRCSDKNYWKTAREEQIAWRWCARMCGLDKAIVGQNFSYDMGFLWETVGIKCPAFEHDTMLMHHAMQPELEKSLAFLGSIYTDEAAWKFMRKGKQTSTKRED